MFILYERHFKISTLDNFIANGEKKRACLACRACWFNFRPRALLFWPVVHAFVKRRKQNAQIRCRYSEQCHIFLFVSKLKRKKKNPFGSCMSEKVTLLTQFSCATGLSHTRKHARRHRKCTALEDQVAAIRGTNSSA